MDLPRFCRFCERAIPLLDDAHMLCRKYGTVNADYTCKKFVYDLLKHVPPPPVKLVIPNEEEFKL